MIKFKQFHSMPLHTASLFASTQTGKEWMETVLPALWAELCTEFGLFCGVVVLKAEDEDSFYESASFGYGEDGFYYSFLNRGSAEWDKLMSSKMPVSFSGKEFPLFGKTTDALSIRIVSEESIGFLLVESEEANSFATIALLSLFAEKIGKEWGKTLAPSFARQTSEADTSYRFFREEIPNLSSAIEHFESKKIVSIFGAPGSGKKTLAKWIHHSIHPEAPILVVESVPDHFGKFEKALTEWGKESRSGSLVFTNVQTFSLGQQQILSDWWSKSGFEGSLFLLGPAEIGGEILPEFQQILRNNSVYLPSLSFLPKPFFARIIQSIFLELCLQQNRSGLLLSEGGEKALLGKVYNENFVELRNTILSGILTCRSQIVDASDLEVGRSRMDLEIPDAEDLDLRRGIEALERQKILLAMRIFSGNQIRMAKALGISRGSLQYKMKQLGLM
ncbi:Response regulator [Leptospira biflexa serovar Patoc strain 'Patoc 1 (Ames)']|uniref:Putative transcriptional regulator n=2 Tax=Leptospira biflexa TaxID=172 RepID=B0SUD0_LEPBP|nr:helix-turn-helix domain-containing protein [Leptospira biflexa]ABZ96090.1 Response regulator [Leptospira biflexa serovar Patoc strain 'Patoc 1 (Ames)']ABZ99814.1 Putative transcriptional regulator [Leptospira biflexa serovar Patoc strain 'Patoc 1 (Paris)']